MVIITITIALFYVEKINITIGYLKNQKYILGKPMNHIAD